MEKHGKTAVMPQITPKRAPLGVVQMNYAPTVAVKYIEQWNEQLKHDEKAPQEVRAVMADVLTMLKIALRNMQPTETPKRPDAVKLK